MFNARTRGSSNYGVIFDIGSGSIGIGIVSFKATDTIPTILYTHREYIRMGERPSTDERIRAMRQALFSATMKLSESGLPKLRAHNSHAKINRALVVCAAPWSQTYTQLIHVAQDEEFEVTKEWVEDLVEKAQKQKPEHIDEDRILADAGMEIVERSISNINLNGYPVNDPYKHKAKEITLVHLYGLLPTDVIKAVNEILEKLLTQTKYSSHTYALVLYCVLRDMYPQNKHALIVDVSGEATELSVMRDHILYKTISVPYGAFTLNREVAQALNTIPEEAKAYLQSWKQIKKTDLQHKAITEATVAYQHVLVRALKQLSDEYVLPQNVYITIDPELLDYFLYVFEDIRQKLSGTTIKNLIPIGPDTAATLATFKENTTPDPFLAVVARFLYKLHPVVK